MLLGLLLLSRRYFSSESFKERMGQCFLSRESLHLVYHKQLFDQIFRLWPHISPELISKIVLPLKYYFLKPFKWLRSKRRIATHDDVEDYSASPQVAFLSVISLNYFRCHIVRCTEKLIQTLVWLYTTRYTEIYKLYIYPLSTTILISLVCCDNLFDQHIFYFEISVDYTPCVAVVYSRKYLLHDESSLPIIYTSLFHNKAEQLASRTKLSNYIVIIFVLVTLVVFKDVRVIDWL